MSSVMTKCMTISSCIRAFDILIEENDTTTLRLVSLSLACLFLIFSAIFHVIGNWI